MPPPVLLIHGCEARWTDWQDGWIEDADVLVERLTPANAPWTLLRARPSAGRHPIGAGQVFLLDYHDAAAGVCDLAWAVIEAIDLIGSPVAVIAHSLGGIIARAYIQNLAAPSVLPSGVSGAYRGDVVGLYTIACPHAGLNWLQIVFGLATDFCTQAALDFLPLSPLSDQLLSGELPASLHLSSYAGTGCDFSLVLGPHDGALRLDDTFIWPSVGGLTQPASTNGGQVPRIEDPGAAHSPQAAVSLLCIFSGPQPAVRLAIPSADSWYGGLP